MKPIFLRTKLLSAMGNIAMPPDSVLPPAEDTPDAPDPAESQPATPDEQTAVITRTRASALAFGKELIHALSADLRQGELSQLEAIWELLHYQVSVVNVANVALKRSAAVPAYFISSRFLTGCYRYLTADPRGFERMHMVTGLALAGNCYTLEQMEKVAMATQSEFGAQADQQALTRALIALSESGHVLHGLFHSHPGTGPRATLPSPDKDIPTHQRLEDGGYPLIGAIFVKGAVQEGFVRFFSANRPFTVTIYGTGVTAVPGETHVGPLVATGRK